MIKANILNDAPQSGSAPEVHFGEHFRQPLWVEFIISDIEKWYGCFSQDYHSGFNKVLLDERSKLAFVVSGGIGYLIDVNKRIVKYKTNDYPTIESLILTDTPSYFVAGAIYLIYIFDSNGLMKEIKPDIMVDGIYFKSQINGRAIGELTSAENQYRSNLGFEVDLESFEVSIFQRPLVNDYKTPSNEKLGRVNFLRWLKQIFK
ncbi:hypothetical protein [Fulvivirga sp.]|uniref:hypothetical protein n=1 Tax=Fulvivirga sp. TaxID=1931237 RepID=UPI0032EBDDF1